VKRSPIPADGAIPTLLDPILISVAVSIHQTKKLDHCEQYGIYYGAMIDLHTHSTCSDGSYTPTALVELASQLGLTALALTDHDTVSGVREASLAASRVGLRFVAGVELEVDYSGGEFHLLGLNLTGDPQSIEQDLREMRQRRHRRNEGIVKKMQKDGLQVDIDSVARFSHGPVLGRPHFARFLVHNGVAVSIQDAFDRFLGRDRKYYLPIERLTVEECSSIIRRAGGHVVIAHPLSLRLALPEIEARLDEWRDAGVDGIEAYHSNAPIEACRELEAIAERHGLFATAGSDFHGNSRADRLLGKTSGGIEIEDRFLRSVVETYG